MTPVARRWFAHSARGRLWLLLAARGDVGATVPELSSWPLVDPWMLKNRMHELVAGRHVLREQRGHYRVAESCITPPIEGTDMWRLMQAVDRRPGIDLVDAAVYTFMRREYARLLLRVLQQQGVVQFGARTQRWWPLDGLKAAMRDERQRVLAEPTLQLQRLGALPAEAPCA